MSNPDNVRRIVPVDIAQTRYTFLRIDLRVCFTMIDFAATELELGDAQAAAQAITNAEKGYATIRRFLAEIDDEEQHSEITVGLSELRQKMDDIRSQYSASASRG
jgi:hypothetical protein